MAATSLQQGRRLFRERLIAALSRRMRPLGPLHRKQVAGALGIHGQTFDRWMRGEGAPAGEMVAELVRFFWAHGDRAFAAELFGIDIVPTVKPAPSAPIAAAVAALDAAKQALLEGAAA